MSPQLGRKTSPPFRRTSSRARTFTEGFDTVDLKEARVDVVGAERLGILSEAEIVQPSFDVHPWSPQGLIG